LPCASGLVGYQDISVCPGTVFGMHSVSSTFRENLIKEMCNLLRRIHYQDFTFPVPVCWFLQRIPVSQMPARPEPACGVCGTICPLITPDSGFSYVLLRQAEKSNSMAFLSRNSEILLPGFPDLLPVQGALFFINLTAMNMLPFDQSGYWLISNQMVLSHFCWQNPGKITRPGEREEGRYVRLVKIGVHSCSHA